MPDFTNEDLDQLFQRGSERYDFEFNPEAWRQMDQLLEKDRRRRLLWWWLAGAGLAVLLLVAILFVFPGREREESSADSPPVARQAEPAGSGGISGPPKEITTQIHSSDPIPSNQSTSSSSRSVVASGGEPAESSPAPAAEVLEKRTRTPAAGQAGRIGGKTPPVAPAASAGRAPLVRRSENPDLAQAAVSEKASETLLTEETDTARQAEIFQGAVALVNPLADLPARAISPDLSEFKPELPSMSDRQIVPDQPVGNPQFVLAFNSAPEATAVGIDAPGKTNVRFGLSLEWRSGQHWSFGAGAYRVKKRYSAQKGEYQPPEGFWGHQTMAPMLTTGWCDIWELPVYAGYYFSGHQRNSFYIEAGFSSLLLKTEWYHYHYERDYPGLLHTWEVHNQNNAFMGLLNIAPGYQVVPHPRWRLQVSPYVQIPMAGIGHGRLQLFSIGLNARIGLAFPMRLRN